jgi:hypothetical protein
MRTKEIEEEIRKLYGEDPNIIECATVFNDSGIASVFNNNYSVVTSITTSRTGVYDENNKLITIYDNLTVAEYVKLLYQVQYLNTI